MPEDYQGLTPPPELVERLRSEAPHGIRDAGVTRERLLIAAAYRAGDDLRLKACVEWLTSNNNPRWALALQEAMRPTPPSLAKEALEALEKEDDALVHSGFKKSDRFALIRRALERLQELEGGNG